MTCLFPFYSGDVKAMVRLLRWIKQLEGCKGHTCTLIADAATSWDDCLEIRELAEQSFDRVDLLGTDDSVDGWPDGPNNLFINAAECVEDDETWLWMEPDAVPLRPKWLDMIAAEYESCGKPYLGAVMDDGKGFKQLAGVAVYPAQAIKDMGPLVKSGEAFDMTTASVTVPQAAQSKRIQHFWGQHQLSPTFVKEKGSILNSFTLDDLNDGAVLFHRNKDGTLIRLLWEKMYPESCPNADILLVIPFWNGDATQAISLLKWIGELDARIPFDVLLTYDNSTMKVWVAEAEAIARRHFRNVYLFQRPTPPSTAWPIGPNFSFTTTATHIMHAHNRPWFWMEPDAIPLKPRWLDTISREYELAGKPFFGPIVKQYGHMNGVAVYPADFPLRCPKTMNNKNVAFDHVMQGEMMHDCCDASIVIQHIWGVENGRPSEVGGDAPKFTSTKQLEWLKPDAVLMHRNKDGSLINLLRKNKA